MFPSTLSYIVGGVAFAFTSMVLMFIGYYYRSREIGLVAALTALISIVFLMAFYAEDYLTSSLLATGHSFREVYLYLLSGASVFRGGDLLQSYWLPIAWVMNSISLGIASIALVGSYLAGETLGLGEKKAAMLSLAVFIVGLIGAGLSIYANSVMNPLNTVSPQAKIQQGLLMRDAGNIVKLVALATTFLLISFAFIKGYREVGEKPLLYNGLSWLILLIGFIMISIASLSWWESIASNALAAGSEAALNAYYILAIIFTLGGAVGVLFSTVAGYVAPTVLGEEAGGEIEEGVEEAGA